MAQVSEVKVPDIGNYTNVPVIEVLVKPGDTVAKDQGLVTLESDKATMEVPSPIAGVVKELKVKLNDEVSEGTVVALIEAADAATSAKAATAPEKTAAPAAPSPLPPAGEVAAQSAAGEGGAGKNATGQAPPSPQPSPASGRAGESAASDAPRSPPVAFGADTVMPDKVPYASPAIRVFARELGVDLGKVSGSGRKNRITKEDV
ncbi:MAG TPA: biotin/lipoyl-containing protein, partial [Rhodanobacteraceae bacterium]|nr:biotin/lipoyl-containing protein [Rhodanobacteraceae bacterium]